MRRVSLFLLATCLLAQSPIGIGPGRLVQSITLGPTSQYYGDTAYCSGWMASAASLPVTTGLPIICTSDDGYNSIDIRQLDTFSYSGVHDTMINTMSSFGTASATNVPSGWWGYTTQTALGSPPTIDSGVGGGWKSRQPLVRGGCIYLPVERQINSGTPSDHDAGIIRSCDSGATWINPYHLAHSGTPVANGDAPPPCNASPCTADPIYMGSFLWLMPSTVYGWSFIQYGQDGSLPGVNPGGLTDPASYACAVLGDGTLGCAPNASIMVASAWKYYAGRVANGVVPDGNNAANWTPLFDVRSTTSITPATGSQAFTVTAGLSGLSTGTRVYISSLGSTAYMEGLVASYSSTTLTVTVDTIAGTGAHTDWDITPRTKVFQAGVAVDGIQITIQLSAPVYIKEVQSFLMVGYFQGAGPTYTIGFMSAPHEWGPWSAVYNHNATIPCGFPAISLGLAYTVVSASPLVVRMTVVTNGSGSCGTGYTWNFQQWEFGAGMQPYGNGEVANYTDIGTKKLNSGWVFGSGETPGTLSRKGLLWAFDFMDHGGDTTSSRYYFRDVSKPSPSGTVLKLCYHNGQDLCLATALSYGATLLAGGVQVNGTNYYANVQSSAGELFLGGNTGNQNVPAALTGNGTFSIVTVHRTDTSANAPLWYFGNNTGNNTALGMNATSSGVGLDWGFTANQWYIRNTGFVFTTGNWYFTAVTVQANGATPISHMWVGVGGVLVDELQGQARIQYGTATQTPNTSATPLLLDADALGGTGDTGAYSYAALLVYDHALSFWEAQTLYRALKLRMAERGVTVQ